jgi:hypothetical protein
MFTFSAFMAAFLVLSHNSVSLLFYGIAGLYVLFFAKTKINLLIGFSALALGMLLSTFYWLPAILEHKYTYGDLFMKDLYRDHFAPLYYFFVPNVLNSKAFQIGNVPVQIGPFHLLGLALLVWYILKHKKEQTLKKVAVYASILSVFAFLFMLPVSRTAWESVSYLRQFQFPWRFLSIIVFTTSLGSLFFFSFNYLKQKVVFGSLIFLVIVTSFMYWIPPEGYDKIDEEYYKNYPLDTTYYGETDVIWSEGEAKSYPATRVDVISGQGKISDFVKKNHSHTFSVDAQTEVQLVDKTIYFPGWRVYIDGKETEIEFQDGNWRGQLVFWAPKGQYDVKVVFEENKLRKLANFVSVGSFGGLIVFGFVLKKNEKS